jgi:hypothetical protein
MNRRKTGQPRIEERHLTIEARKPWLKLEMSRRTWYRRQAEKRKAGSDPGPLSVVRTGTGAELATALLTPLHGSEKDGP